MTATFTAAYEALLSVIVHRWKGQLRNSPSKRNGSDQTGKQSPEHQYQSNPRGKEWWLACVAVHTRCEREILKNSNKKGLLSWPKGDKNVFPSCEQGWERLKKETRDLLFKALCGPILPAIVMLAQAPLPVGVFQSVVGMLESLVPEQTWLPALWCRPVLRSPIICTIGCETL